MALGAVGADDFGLFHCRASYLCFGQQAKEPFCRPHQKIFPKVLIPIVVMQLVCVYPTAGTVLPNPATMWPCFGIFSIVIGVVLSFAGKGK